MAMTRQHYEAIAEVLRGVAEEHEENISHLSVIAEVADRLSVVFKADNPNFSMDRFTYAAGLPD